MPPDKIVAELGFVRLDQRRKPPLFRQLYDQIRTAILDGRLSTTTRIPSSRDLVEQLNVSRTTVVTAIDLLISEGYLQTEVGRGTFVSGNIPNDHPFVHSTLPGSRHPKPKNMTQAAPYLSERGMQFDLDKPDFGYANTIKPFQPGVPALDQFPMGVWSKIVRRVWSEMSADHLSYGEPTGYFPLRESVAEYLRAHRGVRCTAEQVMVVGGTQQATDLVSRLLIDPGDLVLFENPGYVNSREAIEKNGGKIVPLPVGRDGVQIHEATRNCRKARLAYVTPSHQYPLGITMTIERRMELIDWAGKTGSFLVEDDYDSEYRYAQQPIPSMQGLDSSQQTIYIGSFSKVVFPALGMGYLVVPPRLVSAFEKALSVVSRPTSFIDQVILNEFIREGHFIRHLRRMRKTHSERLQVFHNAVQKHMASRVELLGGKAGLHCAALLKGKKADRLAAKALDQVGVVANPLSSYYLKQSTTKKQLNGLVFGFACATPSQLRKAVRKSAAVI